MLVLLTVPLAAKVTEPAKPLPLPPGTELTGSVFFFWLLQEPVAVKPAMHAVVLPMLTVAAAVLPVPGFDGAKLTPRPLVPVA